MNKVGLTIGAVAGICLIAPKFVGDMVEAKYQDVIDRMANHASIEVVESQFSKNWFSGVSVIKVRAKGELVEFQDMEVIVKDAINFGPIVFDDNGISFNLATSNSTLMFSEGAVSDDFIKLLNEKLSINSKITYGLNYVTAFNLKEITKEQDGNNFRIGEMNGEFTLVDDTYMTGEFNWQGANFNGPAATVVINGTQMVIDQEVISGDIYSGNAVMIGGGVFTVPEISVKDPALVDLFALKELAISARSVVVDEQIDITVNYNAKEIKTADQVFKNANLNLIFKHLDADVLAELNAILAQIPTNGDETATAMHMQKVAMVATKLLASNPEILISDLSVETPEGKIQSDMLVTIDNTIYDPANPMSLIAAIKADAKGNGPELFFANLGLQPMLDMYVEQGLLVRNDTDLSFTVAFKQGQLNVNGNDLPLF